MHKCGSWGAIAGLFIGMIYPPVGMILGSLLGAFVAEFLFAGTIDEVVAKFRESEAK